MGSSGKEQDEWRPIPKNKIKGGAGPPLFIWRRESNPQYAGSDEERASLPCCDHQPMFRLQKYTFFNIRTLFDKFFFDGFLAISFWLLAVSFWLWHQLFLIFYTSKLLSF
jgi:hypothetical protein